MLGAPLSLTVEELGPGTLDHLTITPLPSATPFWQPPPLPTNARTAPRRFGLFDPAGVWIDVIEQIESEAGWWDKYLVEKRETNPVG